MSAWQVYIWSTLILPLVIIKKYGKADVVTAFNVFAHSDKLKEILNNVEMLLKDNGEFDGGEKFLKSCYNLIFWYYKNYYLNTKLGRFCSFLFVYLKEN